MNILVLATAATEGGALTILNNLYEDVDKRSTEDTWFFAVSHSDLESTDNIKILRYPSSKKSRLHRLYFDKSTLDKIVKDLKIDLVLSLQNTLSSNKDVKQVLYMHQPLPFVERRYSLLENKTFWLYQNVIYQFIKKSLKKADLIIVQSQWMKQAIHERVKRSDDRVIVSHPQLDVKQLIENDRSYTNKFFYPSGLYSYKNHQLILEAAALIDDEQYSVDFTLDESNEYTKKLSSFSKEHDLDVNYLGSIPYSEVCQRYSDSVLIFASEIETFGLPLLEARLSNSIVLALSSPFAHEILEGYENAYFFEDATQLSLLMKKVIRKEIVNVKVEQQAILNSNSLYDEIEDFKASIKINDEMNN